MNRIRILLLGLSIFVGLAACSSSNNPAPVSPPPPPPPPPTTVTMNGVVTDGPVSGGTLFAFLPEEVQAALDSVDPAGDRLAALTGANSIVTLTRDSADGDQYEIVVQEAQANSPVFLVFDNTDAEDEAFKDTPANLESVVMLGAAGSVQRVNVSLQTTLIAQQVRAMLDPDGDGTIIDDAAIQTAITGATANILSAFATDSLGRDLYPAGFDPISHDDDDEVHAASSAIGSLLRSAGFIAGASMDEVMAVLAADAADGVLDGNIPVSLTPTPEEEVLAAAVSDIASAGSDDDIAVFAVGPCSTAAVSLQQACAVDVLDDLFEGMAICTDILDDDDRMRIAWPKSTWPLRRRPMNATRCSTHVCNCARSWGMPAHDPMYGEAFAANFVDPLEIGGTVTPNPWFPLVTGNRWVYEGDGESIDVVVTSETKLIDGVTCVVVIDTASEDGVVIEITRDWYAQDVDGNVWYCGEIARNFEVFDGDDPETPELVDIDGSWKAGRDGAEPGILLPFDPQPGDVIRQEVHYGEAEDVIRIESVTETEIVGRWFLRRRLPDDHRLHATRTRTLKKTSSMRPVSD